VYQEGCLLRNKKDLSRDKCRATMIACCFCSKSMLNS